MRTEPKLLTAVRIREFAHKTIEEQGWECYITPLQSPRYISSRKDSYQTSSGLGDTMSISIDHKILCEAEIFDSCVGIEYLALGKVGGNIFRASYLYEPIRDYFTSILKADYFADYR